jgi:hypothetical protein
MYNGYLSFLRIYENPWINMILTTLFFINFNITLKTNMISHVGLVN